MAACRLLIFRFIFCSIVVRGLLSKSGWGTIIILWEFLDLSAIEAKMIIFFPWPAADRLARGHVHTSSSGNGFYKGFVRPHLKYPVRALSQYYTKDRPAKSDK